MKIKNKAALVERAKAHLEADHFIQGFYIEFIGKGTDDFKGCEIGCLAMPVKEASRAEVVAQLLAELEGDWGSDLHPNIIDEDSEKLVDIVANEFGVCPALQRLAEQLFEFSSDAESGGKFVVSFTEALTEGADITEEDVLTYLEERNENAQGKEDEYGESFCIWYIDKDPSLALELNVCDGDYKTEVDAFFRWLASM